MREIKFRAWHKKAKVMKKVRGISWDLKIIEFYETPADDYDDLDNYVVMQYSGIKDDNNKEIYEGDIAKIKVGHMETYNAKVLFDVGAFIFEDVNVHQKYVIWESLSRCVIIGNIYENPELLGV